MAKMDGSYKAQPCQGCGGEYEEKFERLRFLPTLKLWLCAYCRRDMAYDQSQHSSD